VLALLRTATVHAAKDFRVPTPDDGHLRLTDFKGKVVLLNFWATWCKPCEDEMPGMERLYRKYRQRGLVVLAVAGDAEGAAIVTPFVRKHGLTFPVGLDPRMALSSQYGVWALPSTFIIDRAGRRALAANGPREWDGKAAEALFESLLR
jgi:peroxiredoxin